MGKRRGKLTYYYLVESARMDGKPRIVSQEYLGTAEEVMAKLAGAATGEPVRTQHKGFGDLAGVWSVLSVSVWWRSSTRSRRVTATRGRRGGGTVYRVGHGEPDRGAVLETGVPDWRATTAGPRWVKTPAGALDHRRFWDAMDCLDTEALRRAETELGRRMVPPSSDWTCRGWCWT